MKPKVYLETTIPSLLTAWPSRDLIVAGQQQATRAWWDERQQYDLFISAFVLDEASQGDATAVAARMAALTECQVLAYPSEAEILTRALLASRLIPAKASADAAHIATAAVHGWTSC